MGRKYPKNSAADPRNRAELGGAARIEPRSISDLKPNPRNARTHSKKQIRQIANSIEAFGFINPVIIDGHDNIIAGHGRIRAAELLKLTRVPTIRRSNMSEAQIRAYVIADNRLAELAGWDREVLAIELQQLGELDLGFDLEIAGFECAEIDLLIADLDEDDEPDEEEGLPDLVEATEPSSRPGDLWQLGDHLLYCGDATSSRSYEIVMSGEQAQQIFTDPPYNLPISGHVSGLGRIKHHDFRMASGEMSAQEFEKFLCSAFYLMASHSVDGSLHYICMDWRHIGEITAAGTAAYQELKNLCVWVKSNGGMGSFYRSRHELVFVFKSGTGRHVNNVELGRFGRWRSNVWEYAGVNSLKGDRLEELAMHPTVKPVAMVADAILDASRRHDIILDPFSGSGTTIIACEKTGRRARAIELEPQYVDVAIQRFQNMTGKVARHRQSGLSYEEVADARKAQ